jgi:hypothetical protein
MRCRQLTKGVMLVALGALAASACASRSTVAAKNNIATARFAIQDAELREAGLYAPEALREAREKLEEAKSVTPDIAQRRAEEATVTARLSAVIADRETALAQLMEAKRVKSATRTLGQETREAVEERAR